MARRKSDKAEISTFEAQMKNLQKQAATRQRQRRNQDRKAVRTTVYLYDDQWKLLDRRAGQSKTDTNPGVGRAEILRALIDFFIELKPDLKKVSSEEEMVEVIKSTLKQG